MEIVIVHSHLNPGGVTRIIESQVDSLKNLPVKVLVGDALHPDLIISKGARLKKFKPLNYLPVGNYSNGEIHQRLEEITAFFESEISSETVLHVHNLNLGKNPVVTLAVYQLAKKGIPVFNHAHDFAEDRPTNFKFLQEIIEGNFGLRLKEVLYPNLPNYHFGVLNSYDRKRLLKYGVKQERILWLPNPVTFETSLNINEKQQHKAEICKNLGLDENKLLVTYPVRVIRRKNIGELILLSKLFENEAEFLVTQPPKNPVEVELYQQWLKFCKTEKSNIVFEAGTRVDFEKLLVASDFCITTSYMEGFGMVYLEPWLLKTPVVGRNIDFLTEDFKADGFRFQSLYNELKIPGSTGDFKDLDMAKQMQVIRDLQAGRIKKTQVFEQNPVLSSLFKKVPKAEIEKNKKIIENNYSLKKYGIKLQNRYKEMAG